MKIRLTMDTIELLDWWHSTTDVERKTIIAKSSKYAHFAEHYKATDLPGRMIYTLYKEVVNDGN